MEIPSENYVKELDLSPKNCTSYNLVFGQKASPKGVSRMIKKLFMEEQIAAILKEQLAGAKVMDR